MIETIRGEFVRDHTGKITGRTHTNIYVFKVPSAVFGPRKSSSDLVAKNAHENKSLTELDMHKPSKTEYQRISDDHVPWSSPPPGGFHLLKQSLGMQG